MKEDRRFRGVWSFGHALVEIAKTDGECTAVAVDVLCCKSC